MKNIQIILYKQLKKVNELIKKREEIYFKRRENWQQSEKGAIYESDTVQLEEIKEDLISAILKLEEITNYVNIKNLK